MDFGPLCEQQGCSFVLCPPANDRWHPWPFFRRLVEAAESLGTEYAARRSLEAAKSLEVIMLEPDNTIHGPIRREPQHDAGGPWARSLAN